jgi:hypothetical protein
MTTLPHAPALFRVQDAYQPAYPARLQEFTAAGWQAGLRTGLWAADEDQETLAVVLIDCQHDFVDPAGTLFQVRKMISHASSPGSTPTRKRSLRYMRHWIRICLCRFSTRPGGSIPRQQNILSL